MRILYIANRAEVFSGGQISLLELLQGLNRRSFEPFLLCPGEGGMAESARDMGIEVRLWDMMRAKTGNIKRIIAKALELRSIIKEIDPDIVHTNGTRAQFYVAMACKGLNTRILWHVREAARDIPLYDWFLAVSSKGIICVSNAVKEKRFGNYPFISSRIRVIYNGVDMNKFNPDEVAARKIKHEIGIDERSRLLGIIGLVIPPKGHRFLFEAFALVSRKYPDARLIVAGRTVNKAYKSDLERLTREMGIAEKVVFLGFREDIKSILSALDIFVLPSENEGFSRCVIEAMSCAKPIITTDIGGNNEAIVNAHSGLLVPYGDVGALAGAIERMLEDPESARRMGENAQKRVRELFSIESHVSSVEKLYEDITK